MDLSEKVRLLEEKVAKLESEEISRFESQYGAIKIKTTSNLHDRFLIIDEEECYDLGTSLNYAGKKIFAINKISNINVIKEIVKIIVWCTEWHYERLEINSDISLIFSISVA